MKKSNLMSMAAAMLKARWVACSVMACAVLAAATPTPAVAQTTAVNRAVVTLPSSMINLGTSCVGTGKTFDASGNGSCTSADSDPILLITTTKTTLPASGVAVTPGTVIYHRVTPRVEYLPAGGTYTTTTVDTLDKGLTLIASSLPAGCTSAAGAGGTTVVTCTHAFTGGGTGVDEFLLVYQTTVDADATGSPQTSVVINDGYCSTQSGNGTACTTIHPIFPSSVTYAKTVVLPNGKTSVDVGDTLTYTLTATVANSISTDALVLTDILGTGLTFASVTANTGGYSTGGSGQVRSFTLPAGALPGTYTVTYTATVNTQASGTVKNAVVGSGGNNGGCASTGTCAPETPVTAPRVTYSKSAALPGGKTSVMVGDLLTYTLSATVTGSTTTQALVLTDTLGTGLTFGSVTANTGGYTTGGSGQVRTFTLPVGTVPGTYTVTYTATVNAQASGTVKNAVVGSGGNDGGCASTGSCSPETPVSAPSVTYSKSAALPGGKTSVVVGDVLTYTLSATVANSVTTQALVLPAGKSTVAVGDAITYTLTAIVTGSATTDALVLTDTLGTGLTFAAVTANSGAYTTGGSGQVRTFTLPAGKLPGTYTVSYTATVNDQAVGSVNNAVVGSGGDNGGCTTPGGCTPDVPVTTPNVTYAKSAALPAGKSTVSVGDAISYTLTATVTGSKTTDALVLTDTLGTGLTFGTVTANTGGYTAAGSGQVRTFTLAAGAVPGTYTVTYTATVRAATFRATPR